jgi:S-adenosylmethionine:tRNA ribosyltransferase-isomerase
MYTSDFDYHLPSKSIAQTPVEPRDASRLLVLDRRSGRLEHTIFREIGRYLQPPDILVLNQTRVIPARLFARKLDTAGKVELLLLRRIDAYTWETIVGGKGMREGRRLQIESGPEGEVVSVMDGARRLVRFKELLEPYLQQVGHVPLPPYIHTHLEDPERYQTVYAREPGSAAAPTAGLHFTPQLIDELKQKGIRFASVTLHIGLDTFSPVSEDEPSRHRIHSEWRQITPEAAQAVNQARREGGRVIAVGTTSVRTLESAAGTGEVENVQAVSGPTDLYILPGHHFDVVDAMITNFHLPRSTLIMLVSAFAGRDTILAAYETARDSGYRFYSFGDAMLIL